MTAYVVKKYEKMSYLWTSPNSMYTFGVTSHWITNDWVLQDVLLDTLEI